MDRQAVLAAFDEQIRRHAGGVEHDRGVIRSVGGDWNGVVWSDLDGVDADAVIAAQVTRFGALGPWEWKHYSYDQPPDLPERLLAAGFTREEPEALMVAEIREVPLVPPPAGVELAAVVDARGVDALVAVHDEVFGAGASRPSSVGGVVAWAGETPVAGGRVEFHTGTDFASLWGDGTLAAWRGQGIFRALVAHRAALAATRGFRYLQVDALPASRPIFARLGFVELAVTTPFVHPG